MDVMLLNESQQQRDLPFDYKASVLEVDPVQIWNTLVSMGRPLWHSYSAMDTKEPHDVLVLAATKLLGGRSPFKKESYGPTTLQGVASLLCRLGLQPQSSSAFASRTVVHFMDVLHYVSYTYDSHICGYVTEPVLAFGAMHLWYESDPISLEESVLPQFLELLVQGVIDIDDVGEIVMRYLLLLAMDATIMGYDEPTKYRLKGGSKCFKGQFCSVKQFLGQLDRSYKGIATSLRLCRVDECAAKETEVSETQRDDFEFWMDSWEGWSVGFSQFVELHKMPTKATLWFLLGRRAAGVLSRNQKEADLIIPVFSKDTAGVSFIVVQVTNNCQGGDVCSPSSLIKLTPASLFNGGEKNRDAHELSKFSPRDIVRTFVSLRESDTDSPACLYLVDTCGTEDSYLICLQGMCRTCRSSLGYWPFLLSDKIFNLLAGIAASAWWDPSARIEADMNRRATGLEPDRLDEAERKREVYAGNSSLRTSGVTMNEYLV